MTEEADSIATEEGRTIRGAYHACLQDVGLDSGMRIQGLGTTPFETSAIFGIMCLANFLDGQSVVSIELSGSHGFLSQRMNLIVTRRRNYRMQ